MCLEAHYPKIKFIFRYVKKIRGPVWLNGIPVALPPVQTDVNLGFWSIPTEPDEFMQGGNNYEIVFVVINFPGLIHVHRLGGRRRANSCCQCLGH